MNGPLEGRALLIVSAKGGMRPAIAHAGSTAAAHHVAVRDTEHSPVR